MPKRMLLRPNAESTFFRRGSDCAAFSVAFIRFSTDVRVSGGERAREGGFVHAREGEDSALKREAFEHGRATWLLR